MLGKLPAVGRSQLTLYERAVLEKGAKREEVTHSTIERHPDLNAACGRRNTKRSRGDDDSDDDSDITVEKKSCHEDEEGEEEEWMKVAESLQSLPRAPQQRSASSPSASEPAQNPQVVRGKESVPSGKEQQEDDLELLLHSGDTKPRRAKLLFDE